MTSLLAPTVCQASTAGAPYSLAGIVELIELKKDIIGKCFIQINTGSGSKQRLRNLDDTDVYRMILGSTTGDASAPVLRESVANITAFMLKHRVKVSSGQTCFNHLFENGGEDFGVSAPSGVLARFNADKDSYGVIYTVKNSDGSTQAHLEGMTVKNGVVTNAITLKACVLYRIAGRREIDASQCSAPLPLLPFEDGLKLRYERVWCDWDNTGYFRRDPVNVGLEDVQLAFPPNAVLVGRYFRGRYVYQQELLICDMVDALCISCQSFEGFVQCTSSGCILASSTPPNDTECYVFRIVRASLDIPLRLSKPLFASEYRKIDKVLLKFGRGWTVRKDYFSMISEMTAIPKGAVVAIISANDSMSAQFSPTDMWYLLPTPRRSNARLIPQSPIRAQFVLGFAIAWRGGVYVHRHTGDEFVFRRNTDGSLSAPTLRNGDETSAIILDDDLV